MTAGRSLAPIAAALQRQRQDDLARRQAADRHFDRFQAALTRRTRRDPSNDQSL